MTGVFGNKDAAGRGEAFHSLGEVYCRTDNGVLDPSAGAQVADNDFSGVDAYADFKIDADFWVPFFSE